LKIRWYLYLITYFNYLYTINFSKFNYLFLIDKYNLKKNFHTKNKTQFNSFYLIKLNNTPSNIKLIKFVNLERNYNFFLFNFFYIFIVINNFYINNLNLLHFSWKSFFLKNLQLGIINFKSIYTRWKNIYFLFFNLFYYNIKLVVFGNFFLKKEISSLNWLSLGKIFYKWKLVWSFFSLKPNKVLNFSNYIFFNFKIKGLNIALVLDILYHSKNLNYLKLNNFYILALVPLYLNSLKIDLPIPISSENIFNQLFFIRFFLKIKKISYNHNFKIIKNLWTFL